MKLLVGLFSIHVIVLQSRKTFIHMLLTKIFCLYHIWYGYCQNVDDLFEFQVFRKRFISSKLDISILKDDDDRHNANLC